MIKLSAVPLKNEGYIYVCLNSSMYLQEMRGRLGVIGADRSGG